MQAETHLSNFKTYLILFSIRFQLINLIYFLLCNQNSY